jgi:enoyl-CoA hydratase/carnithine racemase
LAEASGSDHILYECTDRIATITLNRPDKLNAFTDQMVIDLGATLHRFDVDEDADVAILCGAGRAFCSGADVQQRHLRTEEEFRRNGGSQGWGAEAYELLLKAINWKPIISATHGYAVGMGLGLALECDLTVADAECRFQVAEIRRGLAGSRYWALMRFRGASSFATQVTTTGRYFTPDEALAASVIDYVAPAGQALAVAREVAQEILKNPPLAVRATVRTRRWYMEQAEREAYLQTMPLKLHLSEDFTETSHAFAEKRPAGPFKGR